MVNTSAVCGDLPEQDCGQRAAGGTVCGTAEHGSCFLGRRLGQHRPAGSLPRSGTGSRAEVNSIPVLFRQDP